MDSAITEVCFSQPSKELGTICHAIPYQLALTNNVTSEHDKMVLKLLDKIANWARDKRIVDIYKQKGGWEGWLQVELALLFAGMGGKVTREERIYDTGLGRLRMDLLFKPNPDDQLQYGIELKCQSSGQDELNANTFRDAFKQDLRKVAIGPLVPQEGQNTIMVVLGLG
ncbi:hypothetical protein BKA70DRAFT_232831 [Coprinopsis sp. MPI-PUGE-AT-0042]|nr:hypothetical protein BKA70DRAFT_232831 [Coprinopsis sp. MPI-PUGE-AT-0042]